MVIKGNGAVNTMEAVKINTKEKERTKVTYHKSVFSSVLTGITWGAAILALAVLVFLVGFILIRIKAFTGKCIHMNGKGTAGIHKACHLCNRSCCEKKCCRLSYDTACRKNDTGKNAGYGRWKNNFKNRTKLSGSQSKACFPIRIRNRF